VSAEGDPVEVAQIVIAEITVDVLEMLAQVVGVTVLIFFGFRIVALLVQIRDAMAEAVRLLRRTVEGI
jgi:hypothetical protein